MSHNAISSRFYVSLSFAVKCTHYLKISLYKTKITFLLGVVVEISKKREEPTKNKLTRFKHSFLKIIKLNWKKINMRQQVDYWWFTIWSKLD